VGAGEHLNFMRAVKGEIERIKGVERASDMTELSRLITDEIRSVTGVSTTESLIVGF